MPSLEKAKDGLAKGNHNEKRARLAEEKLDMSHTHLNFGTETFAPDSTCTLVSTKGHMSSAMTAFYVRLSQQNAANCTELNFLFEARP